jgi:hypothetical protein
MEITEYHNYRQQLLEDSKNEDGFISESEFMKVCLPSLNETKLTDTDECNECLCSVENDQIRIDGYIRNESGERLQLFIVNEEALDLDKDTSQLSISQKTYYERHFTKALNFARKAIKKQLDDVVQDSSPARPLMSFLGSSEAMHDIDVIEIFLLSATATVETRGETPQPKRIEFEDSEIRVSYTRDRTKHDKVITVIRKLIDVNFLYNVVVSQGNREVLTVEFGSSGFNYRIPCLKAADEKNFESYLCVLPGSLLAELYRKYSSRMLEKNVRSFLQLRGVNKAMQETIKSSPEKFIAFNNGLTITATGKEVALDNGMLYITSLTDFQIVNGGQTTATIYFSKKAEIDVSTINVMAKINVTKDATEEELDKLISDISTYSNAQTKVSKVDLKSRSLQLVRLKALSESVLTPAGSKWFFERAKGEFNTMIRKSPHQKNRILREYPKERRFTKEELAKYYTAWGDKPHLVKKGGEKVFRIFMEDVTGQQKSKAADIDRTFYESLIAKIILFRTLEKIYGSGRNSIGQIRSAVVPYSLSVLHRYSSTGKATRTFDLSSIWRSQSVEDDLASFFHELMMLMNNLIKKYSNSDDYGEYSKKEELWKSISDCEEIKQFMTSDDAQKILTKYTVSAEVLRKRNSKRKDSTSVDFSHVGNQVSIYANTQTYYKSIKQECRNYLTDTQSRKLEGIISTIQSMGDISSEYVEFEKEFTRQLRLERPDVFDRISVEEDDIIRRTLHFVMARYNYAIENERDVKSDFVAIADYGARKGFKYSSIYREIGVRLEEGKPPSIKQLMYARYSIEMNLDYATLQVVHR